MNLHVLCALTQIVGFYAEVELIFVAFPQSFHQLSVFWYEELCDYFKIIQVCIEHLLDFWVLHLERVGVTIVRSCSRASSS
mmetsp:Transcript_38579/g.71321  ORF Transcript_38579/g.71321 Transcript_38579/m.71321 type:complete len:81 (+) Transcript_38579:1338-1580(+)